MKGITRRWKSIVLVAATLLAGGGSLMLNDGTDVDAAKKVSVYAGAGQAGIAIELFLPDAIIINEGDTVEFINPYEEPHTVTYEVESDPVPPLPAELEPYKAENAAAFTGESTFHSGLVNKGDTFSVTFDKGGAYTLICVLHPGMEIDVSVVGEGIYVPPVDKDSAENKAIIEEGIAVGEAASAKTQAQVDAANANATTDWRVDTGPAVPYEGATVDVMRFLAPEINIDAGDTVTWRNEYAVPHTITFTPGPPPEGFDPFQDVGVPKNGVFDPSKFLNALIISPPGAPVAELSLTFNQPGTYAYVCILHADQGMAGVVNVGMPTTGGGDSGAGGGGTIKPPSTGDAGLLDRSSGSWMMVGGVAMLLVTLSSGVLVAVRKSV